MSFSTSDQAIQLNSNKKQMIQSLRMSSTATKNLIPTQSTKKPSILTPSPVHTNTHGRRSQSLSTSQSSFITNNECFTPSYTHYEQTPSSLTSLQKYHRPAITPINEQHDEQYHQNTPSSVHSLCSALSSEQPNRYSILVTEDSSFPDTEPLATIIDGNENNNACSVTSTEKELDLEILLEVLEDFTPQQTPEQFNDQQQQQSYPPHLIPISVTTDTPNNSSFTLTPEGRVYYPSSSSPLNQSLVLQHNQKIQRLQLIRQQQQQQQLLIQQQQREINELNKCVLTPNTKQMLIQNIYNVFKNYGRHLSFSRFSKLFSMFNKQSLINNTRDFIRFLSSLPNLLLIDTLDGNDIAIFYCETFPYQTILSILKKHSSSSTSDGYMGMSVEEFQYELQVFLNANLGDCNLLDFLKRWTSVQLSANLKYVKITPPPGSCAVFLGSFSPHFWNKAKFQIALKKINPYWMEPAIKIKTTESDGLLNAFVDFPTIEIAKQAIILIKANKHILEHLQQQSIHEQHPTTHSTSNNTTSTSSGNNNTIFQRNTDDTHSPTPTPYKLQHNLRIDSSASTVHTNVNECYTVPTITHVRTYKHKHIPQTTVPVVHHHHHHQQQQHSHNKRVEQRFPSSGRNRSYSDAAVPVNQMNSNRKSRMCITPGYRQRYKYKNKGGIHTNNNSSLSTITNNLYHLIRGAGGQMLMSEISDAYFNAFSVELKFDGNPKYFVKMERLLLLNCDKDPNNNPFNYSADDVMIFFTPEPAYKLVVSILKQYPLGLSVDRFRTDLESRMGMKLIGCDFNDFLMRWRFLTIREETLTDRELRNIMSHGNGSGTDDEHESSGSRKIKMVYFTPHSGSTVFFGNLNIKCTEADIFADLEKADVRWKDSSVRLKLGKGFAYVFVDFPSRTDAIRAVKYFDGGSFFKSKYISADIEAIEDKKHNKNGNRDYKKSYNGGGNGNGNGGKRRKTTVYLGNLKDNVTKYDIQMALARVNTEWKLLTIRLNLRPGWSHAFIDFEQDFMARRLIERWNNRMLNSITNTRLRCEISKRQM